jgi:hypothetical protein
MAIESRRRDMGPLFRSGDAHKGTGQAPTRIIDTAIARPVQQGERERCDLEVLAVLTATFASIMMQ